MSAKKGITLTEVMVVSAIMVILIATLTLALIETRTFFQFSDITAQLESQSRDAIRALSRELRLATSPLRDAANGIQITQNTPAAGTDRIQYRMASYSGGAMVWGQTIQVYVNPGTHQLLRNDGGLSMTVLAENAVSINFEDRVANGSLNLDELRVALVLQSSDAGGKVYQTVTNSVIDMRN